MNGLFSWVESAYPSVAGGTWTPVNRGGSDRQFWRGSGTATGLIAVSYAGEKKENRLYSKCAEFLSSHGVGVPEVRAHHEESRWLLLEDVGVEDLWSHRMEPWEVRRVLYGQALEQIGRMHTLDLGKAEALDVLQEPFDAGLYRWEQDYFFKYFLGLDQAELLRRAVPLEKQAADLAALPRVLIHRDFQSQNVMVRHGRVTLIDFQGMRAGLAGYDLASLVYDPYVPMTPEEMEELSNVYASLVGRSDRETWGQEMRAAGRQRLMQALGAYGFLGQVQGKPSFLEHIPAAAERLISLCQDEAWQPLASAVGLALTRTQTGSKEVSP